MQHIRALWPMYSSMQRGEKTVRVWRDCIPQSLSSNHCTCERAAQLQDDGRLLCGKGKGSKYVVAMEQHSPLTA